MRKLTKKPTNTFWLISIIALLWNIMGVIAYLGQAYMTDEILGKLPTTEQEYYTTIPAWVTSVFAIAVFAGVFGCLALLLRKSWATSLFFLSLVAVLVQSVYNFFMQDYLEVSGTNVVQPLIVIAVASFLILFSKNAEKKRWIS